MTDEFQRYWKDNFPCPPVSYLFKWYMDDRWMRVHSLPESKRYADNDSETAEILRRQKIVLDELIGGTDDCFFVGVAFGEYPSHEYRETVPDLKRFLTTRTLPVLYREIEGEEDCEPDDAFFVEFGKGTVDSDRLSTVLLAIADETLSRFFILNPKSKRIFAPYDGGVDLILENSDSRDEFEKKYAEWLPVDTNGALVRLHTDLSLEFLRVPSDLGVKNKFLNAECAKEQGYCQGFASVIWCPIHNTHRHAPTCRYNLPPANKLEQASADRG